MKAVTEAVKKALKDTEGDRCVEKILENGEKLAGRADDEATQKQLDQDAINAAAEKLGKIAGEAAGKAITDVESKRKDEAVADNNEGGI